MNPNKKLPKVAVCILNYNGMKNKYLERFLPAVFASTYANLDCYVIDNGSTDDSVEYLKKQGFQTDQNPTNNHRFLVALDQNYWFAGGYNIGLKGIEADYYILLNSDVKVAPNWIEPCIELLENDAQIAACQPKIRMYDAPQLFEHAGAAGGLMDSLGYPFCRGRILTEVEEDKGQYDNTEEIFWASGAAFFIRAKLFHQIGGFDADYLAHMEEIDLCWRLKKANYKIMVCPQSVVWHVGGGTLPKSSSHKTFLNFRNSLTTILKNEKGAKAYAIILVRLFLDALAAALFLSKGEFANIGAIVKAHWSFFANFRHYRQKRKDLPQIIAQNAYQNQVKFSTKGLYSKSIIWQYFAKGKKRYSDL